MSFGFYKWLHVMAVVLVVLALIYAHQARRQNDPRKLWAILHGISVGLLGVSGFGMLAKLGITHHMPGWVWLKLLIWLILGFSLTLRRWAWFFNYWILWIPFWVGISTYLALHKPF